MNQLLQTTYLTTKYFKNKLSVVMLLLMFAFNTSTSTACTDIDFYSQSNSKGSYYFYSYVNGNFNNKRISWDFGDGNTGTGQSLTHTYTTAGTYNACVYLWDSVNNCGDTFCKTVCYIAAPKITFTRTGQTITTTLSCNPNISYYWLFGDNTGTQGCNVTHTYPAKEIYQIRIISGYDTISGCRDTMKADTILDLTKCGIVSNFAIAGTVQNTAYVYSKNTKPRAGKEYWYWGDGSNTIINSITSGYKYINHTYANSGNYNICHIIFDSLTNCRDTACKQVTIDSCNVKPNFTFTVSGRKVTVTNTTSNATSYTWNFGNQYTSYNTNPVYTFTSDGTFQICLTASNSSCGKTICKSVTIETCKLSPDFVYTIDPSTGKVQFYNTSLKGMTSNWSFGDGNYDNTGVNRTEHTYNKSYDYTACMTVVNCEQNCSQSVCKPIKFKTDSCIGKQAYFTAAYSQSKTKLSLYNQSNFGNRFLWTVKSVGTAYTWQYRKDSVHFTVPDSTYYVCLYAYDTITGCRDSFCKYIVTDSLPQLAVRHLNNDEQFNVYPNPASNKITIAYKGNDEEIIVKITDINGKLIRTVNVSSGTPLELSTSGLTSGVYIIQPQNQSPPFKLILQ
ncbi:MAG: PKD domain-containing protein [Bacteroidota bacterium]